MQRALLRTLNELLDEVSLLEHIQLEHHQRPGCASLAHLRQLNSAHGGLHLPIKTANIIFSLMLQIASWVYQDSY